MLLPPIMTNPRTQLSFLQRQSFFSLVVLVTLCHPESRSTKVGSGIIGVTAQLFNVYNRPRAPPMSNGFGFNRGMYTQQQQQLQQQQPQQQYLQMQRSSQMVNMADMQLVLIPQNQPLPAGSMPVMRSSSQMAYPKAGSTMTQQQQPQPLYPGGYFGGFVGRATGDANIGYENGMAPPLPPRPPPPPPLVPSISTYDESLNGGSSTSSSATGGSEKKSKSKNSKTNDSKGGGGKRSGGGSGRRLLFISSLGAGSILIAAVLKTRRNIKQQRMQGGKNHRNTTMFRSVDDEFSFAGPSAGAGGRGDGYDTFSTLGYAGLSWNEQLEKFDV